MWIFAFFSFFVTIILSIIVPVLYWTCDWLDVTISSGDGFVNNMGNIVGLGTVNIVKVCLHSGDGDIANFIIPSAA